MGPTKQAPKLDWWERSALGANLVLWGLWAIYAAAKIVHFWFFTGPDIWPIDAGPVILGSLLFTFSLFCVCVFGARRWWLNSHGGRGPF